MDLLEFRRLTAAAGAAGARGADHAAVAFLDEALGLFGKVLHLSEVTGDFIGQAYARLGLAEAMLDQGRIHSAESQVHQVIDLAPRLRQQFIQAQALLMLGDESYPHQTAGGPQRTPAARGTPAEPARPGHRPEHGRSREPRVPDDGSGHDGLGQPALAAGCPDGNLRGQDVLQRAGAHVGMRPAHQRGGAADRGGPAALGSVGGRLLARRQPSAGPGPSRNGAVAGPFLRCRSW